jgi:hypothetical protein
MPAEAALAIAFMACAVMAMIRRRWPVPRSAQRGGQ